MIANSQVYLEDKTGVQSKKEPNFKSLHEMFRHAAFVIHDPSDTYLIRKEKGAWREYSYTEILDFIDQITSWLMEHNLEKGDRVALILENCPEYYCIDQSLQKLGLVNVSIYPTITPEETAFILNDSGAKILFIGNSFLYKKFKKVEDHCPEIKMLVVFPEDIAESDKCIHYSNLLSTGGTMYSKWKETIESRFANVEKEDMATLIYTSGTTGVPKGAMLTQYNFLSNCYDALELVPNIDKNDRYLSFLPLCHVYERMATNYLSHYIGAQVAFAESIEKVAQNITEIKPTIMACVPRLLERIHDKVVKNAKEAGKLKYAIFKWCIRVGDKERELKEAGKTPGAFLKWKLGIAEKLVYSKIKEKMGGRMRLFVSGGGALPPHVGKFFANLGLKVQEGYGLTETSPFITVNEFHRQIYGTVGRVAPRQQVAIQDVETKEIIALQDYYSFKVDFASGEGEILAKGPNIMKGYWNNPKETALVFDAEGWFHTGDIGRFDRGYLKITDRLKNMLVTSLGKNIYPTQLENNYLKSEKIEQIFIIGDKREFVTAIVVPTREELERVFGVDEAFFNMEDPFIREKNIVNWVFSDIKILSENLAKFERVKEILVKRKPFSMEDGDMTITLKIRRKVVMEKFAEEIENLYV